MLLVVWMNSLLISTTLILVSRKVCHHPFSQSAFRQPVKCHRRLRGISHARYFYSSHMMMARYRDSNAHGTSPASPTGENVGHEQQQFRNFSIPGSSQDQHHRNHRGVTSDLFKETTDPTVNEPVACWNTTNNNNNSRFRKDLLRTALLDLDLDADGLESAVQQSMVDPTLGYDGRFGKSAVRACRSFYYPRQTHKNSKTSNMEDEDQLRAAAARTARQVEFLWKRHQSHQASWVRHHDGSTASSSSTTEKTETAQQQQQQQCHRRRIRFPLILILDNVRSANNVGCLFRTADATGCCLVATVGITPHPHGNGADKLHKSALGAEWTVPSQHFATLSAALEFVRRRQPQQQQDNYKYTVLGLETTAHSGLYTDRQYDPGCGVALVLGNEVSGVDTTMLSQLDGLIEIPMFGEKNSLNVAACAPVVLYEILRQWNAAGAAAVAPACSVEPPSPL